MKEDYSKSLYVCWKIVSLHKGLSSILFCLGGRFNKSSEVEAAPVPEQPQNNSNLDLKEMIILLSLFGFNQII